jgi:hypothetical protein
MTNRLIDEMPPYQSADICLESGRDLAIAPVRGWVVREAGYYDRPQVFPNDKAVAMTESPDEATELFCYALAHTKYPTSVTVQPCWIHAQQRVNGEITNRQFWSPR